MPTRITESAFEDAIEAILEGSKGWKVINANKWDIADALFPNVVIAFIKSTQSEEWKKLRQSYGPKTGEQVVDGLKRALNVIGTIKVLRRGFKCGGVNLRIAYFKPASGFNEDLMKRYNSNQLTITRQVKFDPKTGHSLDLLITLNGVPIITAEIKNPATGQNYYHAINQYKQKRNPNAPLFRFRQRALVHFAIDPDEVWMTTRIAKKATQFLPFNQGSKPGSPECGKGNPKSISGHASVYLWEKILQFDSLLEILGSFVFEEQARADSREKTRIIFPRYHQLDALRKLIIASATDGPGHNYLVQHSAGSGKTNTISWLAHQLSSLHTADDQKVFDCVLVITDRRVLDRQLREAIWQIDHAEGVVRAIDRNSSQLAEALIDGTKIIVTTLQKFPFVLDRIMQNKSTIASDDRKALMQIANRNYAIIVDEAHSSQSGETATQLRELLGTSATEYAEIEHPTWEDGLNYIVESRQHQQNLSFYAFTATPKGKTLQLFGQKDINGVYKPFHLYTMRQAIEEEFILNVLENYTTYEVYYRLLKIVENDPDLPERKTTVKLTKYASQASIARKTEIIVEHFRSNVSSRLRGRAKAMVVTDSRKSAIRYKLKFEDYLKKQGYANIKVLVAFSGTVKIGGRQYTEPAMNPDINTSKSISEARLPERFASDDYQVLIVADKYQTGFDQPLLCAMYIDKKLSGIQAVQTISRLNRPYPGKDAPLVLDFVNSMESIREAFLPFYGQTLLPEESNPAKLDQLKYQLDDTGVYIWEDVENYAKTWFADREHQQSEDHQKLHAELRKAVMRYKKIGIPEKREEFRSMLTSYIRMYAFLSQVMYPDVDHEKLYAYGRPLLRMLPLMNEPEFISIDEDVALQYLRIERTASGTINLDSSEAGTVRALSESEILQNDDPRAFLSSIIKELNQQHDYDFNENDLLIFEQIRSDALMDQTIMQKANANPLLEDFKTGMRETIKEMVIKRHSENDDIVMQYLGDSIFQRIIFDQLAKNLFDGLRKDR